jgi:tetratricopeptide (TPR) repeat protein
VAVFSQGTEVFPLDKDLWNNLGYCYSQLKNHTKSFEAYKKAVMIDPSFAQAWQNLGVAAQTLGRRDDPILQVPGLIHQIETNVAQKNFRAALPSAERAVQILPENADAHLSLANILFYLQQFERSEAEFKKAIELRPSFVIAHVNLGRLYQVTGRTDQARQKFQDALAINPNDQEAKQALQSLPK